MSQFVFKLWSELTWSLKRSSGNAFWVPQHHGLSVRTNLIQHGILTNLMGHGIHVESTQKTEIHLWAHLKFQLQLSK